MNAEISETIGATKLGLGMQIPEIPAQRKFVSALCHAHSNARTLKSVYLPHNHILRSRVGGAFQSRLHISISLWSLKLSNGYLIVQVLDYSDLPCFKLLLLDVCLNLIYLFLRHCKVLFGA